MFHGRPGVVRLAWKTESEQDNFGFNIRRSQDKEGEFEVVNDTIIFGAGNSSTTNKYEYYDLKVKVGETYYYYLEDISYSGRTGEFSPIVSVLIRYSIDADFTQEGLELLCASIFLDPVDRLSNGVPTSPNCYPEGTWILFIGQLDNKLASGGIIVIAYVFFSSIQAAK